MKLVLAQNLGKFATLFDPQTVYDTFLPMFFKFCNEQVVQVSLATAPSLIYILEKFNEDTQRQESIVQVVKKNFFEANTFKRRQIFIFMCGEAMNKKELFEKYLKYELLSLVGDKVPNVRMCLSRVLRQHFIGVNGAFVFDNDVNEAVRHLKNDKTADVREPVHDIQTFPMNSESGVLELKDFIGRMTDLIARRSHDDIAETEADSRISEWIANSERVSEKAVAEEEKEIVKEMIEHEDALSPDMKMEEEPHFEQILQLKVIQNQVQQEV